MNLPRISDRPACRHHVRQALSRGVLQDSSLRYALVDAIEYASRARVLQTKMDEAGQEYALASELCYELHRRKVEKTIADCDVCGKHPGSKMVFAQGSDTWICDECSSSPYKGVARG